AGMVTGYLAEWLPALTLFFICLPNLIFLSLGAFLLYLKQREAEFSFMGLSRLITLVKNRYSLISPS
ncbi:MAG: hypothetical protein J7M09_02375, partial [Deltaproteobacteria bacterium]|nr:hypothetical protein [Candidatus Tharpella sp.]